MCMYICTFIPLVWRIGAFVVVYTTATPAVFRLVRLLLLSCVVPFYAYTLTYGNQPTYIGYILYIIPQTSSFCPKHLDFVSCSCICVFILFYFFPYIFSLCVSLRVLCACRERVSACVRALFGCYICSFFSRIGPTVYIDL